MIRLIIKEDENKENTHIEINGSVGYVWAMLPGAVLRVLRKCKEDNDTDKDLIESFKQGMEFHSFLDS